MNGEKAIKTKSIKANALIDLKKKIDLWRISVTNHTPICKVDNSQIEINGARLETERGESIFTIQNGVLYRCII